MMDEVKVTVSIDGLDDLMSAIDDVNVKILELNSAANKLLNMRIQKSVQPPIGSDG